MVPTASDGGNYLQFFLLQIICVREPFCEWNKGTKKRKPFFWAFFSIFLGKVGFWRWFCLFAKTMTKNKPAT
jgi:hypothetical protein